MTESLLTALVVAVPATLSALSALIVALKSRRDIKELHLLVNSRLTELLTQTAKASRAEGVTSEKNNPTP